MAEESKKGRNEGRPAAHAVLKGEGLRMVNGRLVGQTLADPEVKRRVTEFKNELRKDPVKLRQWYVEQGLLTPTGKLTKEFGG